MKILITGGGTAGHVTPLKSVIKELRKLDKSVEFVYIAQDGDRFAELLEVGKDIEAVEFIKTGKYRRYKNQSRVSRLIDIKTHFQNFTDLFRVLVSIYRSRQIIKKYKPDVVFAKGGFVSVPVGLAARLLKLPLIIHESDSRLGFANRILSGSAKIIAFGMPTTSTTLAGKPIHYVGIPLRSEFISWSGKSSEISKLKVKLGLDEKLPLVTVSGGSLGAQAINHALLLSLQQILDVAQVVHITGDNNLDSVNQVAQKLSIDLTNYSTIGFTDDIAQYLKASQVVVTRASATTFSELAALGKATILIPAKQLSDQIENARAIEGKKAAEVLTEAELENSPDLLGTRLYELLNDQSNLDVLKKNIKALAKPNAGLELSQLIIKVAASGLSHNS